MMRGDDVRRPDERCDEARHEIRVKQVRVQQGGPLGTQQAHQRREARDVRLATHSQRKHRDA